MAILSALGAPSGAHCTRFAHYYSYVEQFIIPMSSNLLFVCLAMALWLSHARRVRAVPTVGHAGWHGRREQSVAGGKFVTT
jgi:hypothetical protein